MAEPKEYNMKFPETKTAAAPTPARAKALALFLLMMKARMEKGAVVPGAIRMDLMEARKVRPKKR